MVVWSDWRTTASRSHSSHPSPDGGVPRPGGCGVALVVSKKLLAGLHISSNPHKEPSVQGGYTVETDLNLRIFDGRDEHRVACPPLSGVDDFTSASMTETGVTDRLDATVPNVPFSAAIF